MLDLISERVSVVITKLTSVYSAQIICAVINIRPTANFAAPKKQTPTRRVGTLPANASDFLAAYQPAHG